MCGECPSHLVKIETTWMKQHCATAFHDLESIWGATLWGALRRPIGGSKGSGPNAGDKIARNMAQKSALKALIRTKIGAGRATSVEEAEFEGHEPARALKIGFLDTIRAPGTSESEAWAPILEPFSGDPVARFRAAPRRPPDEPPTEMAQS